MNRLFARVILKHFPALTLLVALIASSAWSVDFKVLYNFPENHAHPGSGLTIDANGNAYGVTTGLVIGDDGTVYELSPPSQLRFIFRFGGKIDFGLFPEGTLAIDAAGNLYGEAIEGGNKASTCSELGCGVVFKLAPPSNGGAWTETVLYKFCSQLNCTDGMFPNGGGLIMDSSGNLYGVTQQGGDQSCISVWNTPGCGVVFELSPGASGWVETVLYAFTDGSVPLSNLLFDGSGNLYGVTNLGGPTNVGSVFCLSPSSQGWSYQTIYGFGQPDDGARPAAGLIVDSFGNLYGTTGQGGYFNYGIVFELTPGPTGWTEAILYDFESGSDGALPDSKLIFDTSGNLYGATEDGGGYSSVCENGGSCGTVFKLTPQANGQWTESLFRFPPSGLAGYDPWQSLTFDPAGNLYGVTGSGGDLRGVVGSGVLYTIRR